MQYITEAEIDRITSDTMTALRKEPRVTITVQPENGENSWEGGINGHFFRIKTGVPVSVPESLARLIGQSCVVKRECEAAVAVFSRGRGKKMA